MHTKDLCFEHALIRLCHHSVFDFGKYFKNCLQKINAISPKTDSLVIVTTTQKLLLAYPNMGCNLKTGQDIYRNILRILSGPKPANA